MILRHDDDWIPYTAYLHSAFCCYFGIHILSAHNILLYFFYSLMNGFTFDNSQATFLKCNPASKQ